MSGKLRKLSIVCMGIVTGYCLAVGDYSAAGLFAAGAATIIWLDVKKDFRE